MTDLIAIGIVVAAVALLVSGLVKILRRHGGTAPDAAANRASCDEGCISCATGCFSPIKEVGRRPRPMILYYEDEELDRFRGRAATDYSDREAGEFREVLETLSDADLSGWVTSIHRRGLHFPVQVAEEVTRRLSAVLNG